MKLSVAYYGSPILRKKCQRVEGIDDDIRQLVQDMEETLIAHDGCGLAAPQVKRDLALFLVKDGHLNEKDEWIYEPTRVYINPKILQHSDEEWTRTEACLSIPKIHGHVTRPLTIKIEATGLDGVRFEEVLTGLPARIFLHENDHINGVLYIDRVKGKERLELEPYLRQIKKQYS
jgi:peptide deformylase